MIRSLFSRQNVELTEEALLALIREGDDIAFRYLYKRTFPHVRQFVVNNNGKEADAEDVFQDGILALWNNIQKGSFILHDEVKISSYLSKICRYRWLERVKSAGHKRSVALPEHVERADESSNALGSLISSEEIVDLENKFRQLGDKCQEILKLYYYEKKSMAEIATILDMQPNSVKNEKYRCMEKLKKLF